MGSVGCKDYPKRVGNIKKVGDIFSGIVYFSRRGNRQTVPRAARVTPGEFQDIGHSL
jgi:hypothetical protein